MKRSASVDVWAGASLRRRVTATSVAVVAVVVVVVLARRLSGG